MTLDCGNYGIFLIMGHAGHISSTVLPLGELGSRPHVSSLRELRCYSGVGLLLNLRRAAFRRFPV